MNTYFAPLPRAHRHIPSEVGLEPVDRPQVKALCEAGYLPLARYVELVAALGWDRVDEDAPAVDKHSLPPMAQQPWRDLPITSVA